MIMSCQVVFFFIKGSVYLPKERERYITGLHVKRLIMKGLRPKLEKYKTSKPYIQHKRLLSYMDRILALTAYLFLYFIE